MPSHLTDAPPKLQLYVEFPNGHHAFDFSSTPCPDLARALVQTLLAMTNTGGGVKSKKTAVAHSTVIRRYARWLAAQGFTGGLADLAPEHVDNFILTGAALDKPSVATFKSLLRRAELEHAGVMREDTVAHAHARTTLVHTPTPLPPYSEGEAKRLEAACKRAITELEANLKHGRGLLASGHRPANTKESLVDANILWLLNHHGPKTREALAEAEGYPRHRYCSREHTHHSPWRQLCRMLWPTVVDLVPYLVLLGLQCGISPEGIMSMRADGMEMLGEGKVRLHYFKARGGGGEAETFSTRAQWSPGQLVTRVLAVTSRARACAPEHERNALWLALAPTRACGTNFEAREVGAGLTRALREFVAAAGLEDDQGRPLALDRRRLRKTFYVRLDRRFHGAVSIIAGANQSQQVAADHYLMATVEDEHISAAIEETQQMLVARAGAASRVTVLSEERMQELLADPEAASEAFSLPMAQTQRMLQSTEEDVFAAKCKDFHNSPHGKPGQPCPAAVWECLFCPLAVITPTKLPNLLRLLDHIDTQSQQMELFEWQRRYLSARRAITDQILPQFTEAVLAAARSQAAHAPVYFRPEELVV